MSWTKHGHHIPGTNLDVHNRPDRKTCDGINDCSACGKEAMLARTKEALSEKALKSAKAKAKRAEKKVKS